MKIKKKVIIIGGGFAGLQLVENLDEDIFDILLIDKLNHHQFQPLFYQVATSQIEPSSISFPLRKIFQRKTNLQIRLAEVLQIKPQENQIETTVGNFSYDQLIIATGCKTNFFGNQRIEEFSYGLKTTYDAIKIRNALLLSFEKWAAINEDVRTELLNILIVGGGPTGVELAGSLAEIKKNILPRDFPKIDFSKLNIIILEGSPNTLNNMSQYAQKAAKQYLENLGVQVLTNIFVTDYDGKIAMLSNKETITSQLVIWAAGVTGNIIGGLPESALTKSGRYKVTRYNQIASCPNIYAVGDIAMMETERYPRGHPQLANVAIHQAKTLAKNLAAEVAGKQRQEYEYTNLGTMATIGKHKAIVDLPFLEFKGLFAWFVWMFLHLMLILSVRNKLIIFIHWAWNYISNDTSLRLILREHNKSAKTNLE